MAVRAVLDFTGRLLRATRQEYWTLPGPGPLRCGSWTLPGLGLDFTGPAYVSKRLSAPRDGAIRAGTGGLDGFRIMPVVPSSDTSASG